MVQNYNAMTLLTPSLSKKRNIEKRTRCKSTTKKMFWNSGMLISIAIFFNTQLGLCIIMFVKIGNYGQRGSALIYCRIR